MAYAVEISFKILEVQLSSFNLKLFIPRKVYFQNNNEIPLYTYQNTKIQNADNTKYWQEYGTTEILIHRCLKCGMILWKTDW